MDEANSCGFMQVVGCEFPVTCWHAVCSLLEQGCYKRLASRGGRNPTSTGLPVFGGSVLRKRGLAPVPFFTSRDVCSKWLVRNSCGWSCLSCFSPVGRKTARPSVCTFPIAKEKVPIIFQTGSLLAEVRVEPGQGAGNDVALVLGVGEEVAFALIDHELGFDAEGLEGVPEFVGLRGGNFAIAVAD